MPDKATSYLLDTTALLAHFRDEPGHVRVQEILTDRDADILVSALSVAEFARRMRALGASLDEARQAAFDYASLANTVVHVDTAVALRAFELGGVASERLPLVDALIAASAMLHDAVLVHRDSHFSSIPEDLLPQIFLQD